MATGARLAALLIVLVQGPSCASSRPTKPGDAQFAAGDFAAAATAYEELVSERPGVVREEPELAFRLALAHAVPGHPETDLDRSRQLLEPLLDDPATSARGAALVALIVQIENLQRDQRGLEVASAIRGGQLRQCEAGLDGCEDLLDDERRLRAELEAENLQLRERVAALEKVERDLAIRLRELAGELAAIKRIDLEGSQ
jgi:non-ribosomal peptide synthetase component F